MNNSPRDQNCIANIAVSIALFKARVISKLENSKTKAAQDNNPNTSKPNPSSLKAQTANNKVEQDNQRKVQKLKETQGINKRSYILHLRLNQLLHPQLRIHNPFPIPHRLREKFSQGPHNAGTAAAEHVVGAPGCAVGFAVAGVEGGEGGVGGWEVGDLGVLVWFGWGSWGR